MIKVIFETKDNSIYGALPCLPNVGDKIWHKAVKYKVLSVDYILNSDHVSLYVEEVPQ